MRIRPHVARSFGAAVLASGALSCALVMSFDDYDTTGTAGSGDLFGVRGEIDGLEGAGTLVTLEMNGVPAKFDNGDFEFPPVLANAAPYALTATNDTHACEVVPPSGTVNGATVNVLVHCKSTVSALESLSVTGMSFAPAFDGANTKPSFTVPFLRRFQPTMEITAVAKSESARIQARFAGDAGTMPLTSRVATPAPTPALTAGVDLIVTALAGNATTYQLRPAPSPTYFKPSNTPSAGPAGFGLAVALDGDTLVVGAPYEEQSSAGVDANQNTPAKLGSVGAVYVFRRTNETWAQEAYVKSPTARGGGYFGQAVALSGDTLIVGEPGDGLVEGAAYVLRRGASAWAYEATLKKQMPTAASLFGRAVALSGDTIVVGAEGESSNAGAGYVFRRAGSLWSQEARLVASNARSGARFGLSVALDGDVVVIGSPGETSNATGVNGNQGNASSGDAGAAYVFRRAGTSWAQEAYLKASNTSPIALFGSGVSASGDTVAVGAPRESSTTPRSGAAYVFQRTGGAWAQEAFVKASNPQEDSKFGASLVIARDSLAIGAAQESGGGTGINGPPAPNAEFSGAVYVVRRDGSSWTQVAYVKASNARASARFGSSLALSGDSMVVGSFVETGTSIGVNGDQAAGPLLSGAGAAYLF